MYIQTFLVFLPSRGSPFAFFSLLSLYNGCIDLRISFLVNLHGLNSRIFIWFSSFRRSFVCICLIRNIHLTLKNGIFNGFKIVSQDLAPFDFTRFIFQLLALIKAFVLLPTTDSLWLTLFVNHPHPLVRILREELNLWGPREAMGRMGVQTPLILQAFSVESKSITQRKLLYHAIFN